MINQLLDADGITPNQFNQESIKLLTVIRQMIVHSVKPQMPDDIGDISTTFSMIFIITSTSTTSMPILPGYAAGGTRKLSQLTKTMMNVGK